MRQTKSAGAGYGLFLPEGSSIWYWRRQYKGRKLGRSTGEIGRARALQLAKEQYKEAVRQIDAEIESGRKPMTLGRASELYCAEVVSGKPGEESATRELAWIESILGVETFLHDLNQAHITQIRNERRVMTTTRAAGKDEQGRPLEKLVSHSTVNRTMQTLRAALYHVRDHHGAFLPPNLKFGITKEQARKREVSEAEEAVLVEHLREDFDEIFAFALLSGIRETGLCTLERSKVDLVNAQVTFQSKRHRDDPPGFIRWETQALGPLEVALLTDIIATRHHSKYVFTYVARGKKGGKGGTGQNGAFEAGKHYPITVEALTTRWQRDRATAARVMASVADINWHDLRHTFASRLLRKTRNPAWVQKALGHASINTTMRHYAHVLNDDVRQAKAEVQGADAASPAMQKLQGKLQGRPNLKLVG
jgi:Phage integrase family